MPASPLRRALPLLLLLALAGGGAWWVASQGGEEPELDLAPTLGPVAPPAPADGVTLAPRTPPAPPEPEARGTNGRRAEPVSIDPRTLPRGPLAVLVLGPDDVPIPPEGVTVSVEAGKGSKAWHEVPLLIADPETGVWRAEDVFVGPVKVRVSGDTLVTREVETQVAAGAGETLRVHVDRAGSLEYTVLTFADEDPGDVVVRLTGEGGKAALVTWQVRTQSMLTQPRLAREVTQASKGGAYGIPPGRYTLRATSVASGEYEEALVDVEAHKTLTVALKVRR